MNKKQQKNFYNLRLMGVVVDTSLLRPGINNSLLRRFYQKGRGQPLAFSLLKDQKIVDQIITDGKTGAGDDGAAETGIQQFAEKPSALLLLRITAIILLADKAAAASAAGKVPLAPGACCICSALVLAVDEIMQRLQQVRDLILLRLDRQRDALQVQQPFPRILLPACAAPCELHRKVLEFLHGLPGLGCN